MRVAQYDNGSEHPMVNLKMVRIRYLGGSVS